MLLKRFLPEGYRGVAHPADLNRVPSRADPLAGGSRLSQIDRQRLVIPCHLSLSDEPTHGRHDFPGAGQPIHGLDGLNLTVGSRPASWLSRKHIRARKASSAKLRSEH